MTDLVAEALERAQRAAVACRSAYVDLVCLEAWTETAPEHRRGLRLLVNEPPPPERGAPQDLGAILASPIPAPFSALT